MGTGQQTTLETVHEIVQKKLKTLQPDPFQRE
jgi:hypothetical protein